MMNSKTPRTLVAGMEKSRVQNRCQELKNYQAQRRLECLQNDKFKALQWQHDPPNLDLQSASDSESITQPLEPQQQFVWPETTKMARLEQPQPMKTPINRGYQLTALPRSASTVRKTTTFFGSNLVHVKDYGFYKQSVIGCGSFSKVYRGFKLNDSSFVVAIKEIRISQVGHHKIQQEIQIHEKINRTDMRGNSLSNYIVQLYDYHIDRGQDVCYLILEYCPQGSIDQQYKLFSRKKSLVYFSQILNAMRELHANNIIHRDLKLENILVKNNQIKLADFGFAKALPEDLSVQSYKCGTPATMAPELIFCEDNRFTFTDKQDVWSLGVILHELFYKEHPFAQNRERMRNQYRIQIKQKDPLVESFLAGALQFDPKQRMSLRECFEHELIREPLNFVKSDIVQTQFKRLPVYNNTDTVRPTSYGGQMRPVTPRIKALNQIREKHWIYQALAFVWTLLARAFRES